MMISCSISYFAPERHTPLSSKWQVASTGLELQMPAHTISPANTGVHGWPSQYCSTRALIGSFHTSCVTIQ